MQKVCPLAEIQTLPCQGWTISISRSSEVHSPWLQHPTTRKKLQAVWVRSVLGLNKHVSDWWEERNVTIHSNQTLYSNMLTLTKHSACLLWNGTSGHFVKRWADEPCPMVTAHRVPLNTVNYNVFKFSCTDYHNRAFFWYSLLKPTITYRRSAFTKNCIVIFNNIIILCNKIIE